METTFFFAAAGNVTGMALSWTTAAVLPLTVACITCGPLCKIQGQLPCFCGAE